MYRYTFLLLFIFFAACSNDTEKPVTGSTDTAHVAETTPADTALNPYADLSAWQGNLDGRIPVIMWYKEKDSVLNGMLFYTENKNGQPVRLVGYRQNGRCVLYEVWRDGDITGIWNIEPGISSAEGYWHSPATGKQWNTSMMHIDTAVLIPSFDAGGTISGEYAYSYGDDGAQGILTVKKTNGKVNVSFMNVTATPARNQAVLDAENLELNKNEITYHSDEYEQCSISIKFYRDFAIVNYINGNDQCGFGHNAHVDGVYIKTTR